MREKKDEERGKVDLYLSSNLLNDVLHRLLPSPTVDGHGQRRQPVARQAGAGGKVRYRLG